MKAYFLSGLGADERVFQNVSLPDQFEPVYIKWMTPSGNDTLQSYALKLATNIDEKEPFVLIGLSIGGMLAVEISKVKKPLATILISSAATYTELPKFYRFAGSVGLHKLLPAGLYKTGSFLKRYFTTETPECKKIIRQLIKESDPEFIRWGVDAIVHWKNEVVPPGVYRIHGSKDEILPLYTEPNFLIPNGKHMMVLDRAHEINPCLAKICAKTLDSGTSS